MWRDGRDVGGATGAARPGAGGPSRPFARAGELRAPGAVYHPPVVEGLRFMTARGWNFPWRKLAVGLEVCLLEAGAAEWRVDRWRGTRTPGTVCAVEPGDLAVGTRILGAGSFFLVEADPAQLPEPGPRRARQYEDPGVTRSAARLAELVRAGEGPLAVESAFAELLQGLGRAERPVARETARSAAVRRLREVLHDRFREPISLAEVAGSAGVSRFHAVRAFKEALDVTPFEYLMHVRLCEAARSLRAGARPGEVAAAAGFADQPHLSRWFSRMFQATPGAYARAYTPSGRAGAR